MRKSQNIFLVFDKLISSQLDELIELDKITTIDFRNIGTLPYDWHIQNKGEDYTFQNTYKIPYKNTQNTD